MSDTPARDFAIQNQPGDLDALRRAALNRRAMRHFRPDPLPAGLLEELLAITQRTPSGYNLQPWVAIVVTDEVQRRALRRAALDQSQVEEAPATVVFASDTRPVRNLRRTMDIGRSSGHWSEFYLRYIPPLVRLMFQGGPFHLLQPLKWLMLRPISLFRPMPMIPGSGTAVRGYVDKQTALAAQTFMLAAAAAGLDTCPMEGLDARWVRRVVGLPRRFSIPVIVPVGYAAVDGGKCPRFAPETVFFQGRYATPLPDVPRL